MDVAESSLPNHLPQSLPHGIIIAATPLGNINDASPRLIQGLRNADVIAAEDTRRTAALAAALGVKPKGKIVSNFDHNESDRIGMLLEVARSGAVLVISDAGMPVISDPGFVLIDAAHDAGIPVTCFPGPSAVPTALALSGLHTGRFIFDGFAPRKQQARRNWLASLKNEPRAVCFFESPHRIAATLRDAAEVLSSRRATVSRELSKTYEEVRRGLLPELAEWAEQGIRGEITVVIEGMTTPDVDEAALVDHALDRISAGERLKDVTAELAAQYGLRRKELYDAVVLKRDERR